jgi:N-acetylated-alpha-linked acidic dipeptidase
VFAAIADPRRPLRSPAVEAPVPAINFAPLENAVSALSRAADRYKRAGDAARPKLTANRAALASVNAKLIQSERQFIDTAGLVNRPWYRHLLYAPGYYTGYAVKTLPGVREAIEQKLYADVEKEVVRLAAAIQRETGLVDAAAAELEGIGK